MFRLLTRRACVVLLAVACCSGRAAAPGLTSAAVPGSALAVAAGSLRPASPCSSSASLPLSFGGLRETATGAERPSAAQLHRLAFDPQARGPQTPCARRRIESALLSMAAAVPVAQFEAQAGVVPADPPLVETASSAVDGGADQRRIAVIEARMRDAAARLSAGLAAQLHCNDGSPCSAFDRTHDAAAAEAAWALLASEFDRGVTEIAAHSTRPTAADVDGIANGHAVQMTSASASASTSAGWARDWRAGRAVNVLSFD